MTSFLPASRVPSQAVLRDRLEYDPETGIFRRKNSGAVITARTYNGYIRFGVAGFPPIAAHRAAWCYVYGAFPDCEVDHINGDRADNRIVNLRLASASENQRNRKPKPNSLCGLKGVSYVKVKKHWKATIWVDGRAVYLGAHRTPEAAHAAYCTAATKYFGAFARFE